MGPPYSFLTPWLERKSPLASYIDLENTQANQEFGGFLGLQRAIPAHESIELSAESLGISWVKVENYVTESLKLIDADEPGWLDRYEAELIQKELGPPPVDCLPIYLVSVGSGPAEKLVYIGKTSSKRGRFQGGHSAFTKLLHPKFDGLKKTLYLASVMLLSNEKEHLPLEWTKPIEKAEKLLGDIEAQLIFQYKPELNTNNVWNANSRWPTTLHIQNVTGSTGFLNDEFCHPPT